MKIIYAHVLACGRTGPHATRPGFASVSRAIRAVAVGGLDATARRVRMLRPVWRLAAMP